MGSDFEEQRRERESARRAAAANRDAERRSAFNAGARAPHRAVGQGGAPLGLMVLFGLMAGCAATGALVAYGAYAAAVTAGGGLLGTLLLGRYFTRLRRNRAASLRGGESHLTPAPWSKYCQRAREAVENSGLDEGRKLEVLSGLRMAADEIADLSRKLLVVGGTELAARTDERIAAFVTHCQQIESALLDSADAAAEEGLAGAQLEQIAGALAEEAEARTELDEALRQASTRRAPAS